MFGFLRSYRANSIKNERKQRRNLYHYFFPSNYTTEYVLMKTTWCEKRQHMFSVYAWMKTKSIEKELCFFFIKVEVVERIFFITFISVFLLHIISIERNNIVFIIVNKNIKSTLMSENIHQWHRWINGR
jgi:hypothetical protein